MDTTSHPRKPAASLVLHGCKPGDANCWNRIGISGDRSCSELNSFVHCRNCPVFADAARTFFERPAPEGYLADWSQWLAESAAQPARDYESDEFTNIATHGDALSCLIFQLGSEWLAFRTRTIALVTKSCPIHRVPHRTNQIFLGLGNLQGQLELCVSLHGLLGIAPTTAPGHLVVLRDQERGETWAFPTDEISGVERVPRDLWRAVPSTLANPAVGFSQAVLSWKERSVGLLDEQRVFAALRSLGM